MDVEAPWWWPPLHHWSVSWTPTWHVTWSPAWTYTGPQTEPQHTETPAHEQQPWLYPKPKKQEKRKSACRPLRATRRKGWFDDIAEVISSADSTVVAGIGTDESDTDLVGDRYDKQRVCIGVVAPRPSRSKKMVSRRAARAPSIVSDSLPEDDGMGERDCTTAPLACGGDAWRIDWRAAPSTAPGVSDKHESRPDVIKEKTDECHEEVNEATIRQSILTPPMDLARCHATTRAQEAVSSPWVSLSWPDYLALRAASTWHYEVAASFASEKDVEGAFVRDPRRDWAATRGACVSRTATPSDAPLAEALCCPASCPATPRPSCASSSDALHGCARQRADERAETDVMGEDILVTTFLRLVTMSEPWDIGELASTSRMLAEVAFDLFDISDTSDFSE